MDSATYSKLVNSAKGFLYDRRVETVAPEDIVSDAYLLCISKGKEPTFDNINNLFRRAIGSEQWHVSRGRDSEFSKESARICSRCNELKPSACFYIVNYRKEGVRWVMGMCYDCFKIRNAELKRKRRRKLRGDMFGKWPKRGRKEKPKIVRIYLTEEERKIRNKEAQREWYNRNKERLKSDPEYLKKASQRSYACQLRKKHALLQNSAI